jgi:hypothetical protein
MTDGYSGSDLKVLAFLFFPLTSWYVKWFFVKLGGCLTHLHMLYGRTYV